MTAATAPLWTAADLREATGGAMPIPFDATGISIDTRTLAPGDLFVALQGDTDGHAHVGAALARGAAGVLVHRAFEGAPQLLVPDTLRALEALGRAARARFRGRVVAITGSVGKTTTKEMLRTALTAFGPTHAAVASYNNHWGVPLTLARLPQGAAFCVAEIGMNTAGEIMPLARLAAPHAGVVTTIAPAHIGRLGSIEAIAEEKASLLDGLVPGGVAVLPADSPYLAALQARAPGRTVTFGTAQGADLRLLGHRAGVIQATIQGRPLVVHTAAPGAHMAANVAATLACVHALGLDPARAAAALMAFTPGAGRGQQRRVRGDQVLLLDESYNANTASVRAALSVLREMPGARRLAILGDMLELGDFAPAEHSSLAPDVAQSADLLYACGPNSRVLFDAVPARRQGAHAADSAALAPIVAAAIRPGDAVLVKGSLGSRMRLVVQALEAAGC